jgi:hypothetical protein
MFKIIVIYINGIYILCQVWISFVWCAIYEKSDEVWFQFCVNLMLWTKTVKYEICLVRFSLYPLYEIL